MAEGPVDLLVIGAGITGAGVARDASMRGIRTAIVDKDDFGSGTSSRSSRLIHGGLRYLEHHDWRLVFEASRERRVLLAIAPHLVWPRSFLIPSYSRSRLPLWKLAAGLWLYDLLALFRNLRAHRMLGKSRLLREEPGLRERGLRGAGLYYDAQCDDARLTLANVRSAHRHGALTANYVGVTRLEIADGTVRGAHVIDRVTGSEFLVRAAILVNATGPWSDEVRGATTDGAALRRTKGVHVAVPRQRLGNQHALAILSPIDGRLVFVVPWGDLSYIGTTDTDTAESADSVRAEGSDVVYLLRSVNALFPNARLQPDDIVSTWAGVRPLLATGDPCDPSSVSREHRIIESDNGLITIAGGKLTTYRVMARDVVNRVRERLRALDGRKLPPGTDTAREPLPGGEVRDTAVLVEEAEREGFPRVVAEHLVRAYGAETPAITRLARSDVALSEHIVPGHPALRAELVHAMRREMAMTLGDLLIRRTHVFYETSSRGAEEATVIGDLAARELGWSDDRREAELAAYLSEIQRTEAFQSEMESSETFVPNQRP